MVPEEERGERGDADVRQRHAPRRARASVRRPHRRLDVGLRGGLPGRHALVRRRVKLPPHRRWRPRAGASDRAVEARRVRRAGDEGERSGAWRRASPDLGREGVGSAREHGDREEEGGGWRPAFLPS